MKAPPLEKTMPAQSETNTDSVLVLLDRFQQINSINKQSEKNRLNAALTGSEALVKSARRRGRCYQ